MRILQTLTFVKYAGLEKLCIDLCNELAKHHEVYLLTDVAAVPYLSQAVKFVAFDFNQNRYNPVFLYKTRKLLQNIQPHIIHCHNAKEVQIIYNAQYLSTNKIKIIATKHMVMQKKKLQLADLQVELLEDKTKLATPNSIVIENGIPYRLPIAIERPPHFHIVSIGRLDYEKGHQTIIEALANVNFDFQLSILGTGNYKDELQCMINRLNLQDRVKLVGFVNNVQDYLASADLQVIASHFESYCLAAIEGVYYSKALISTPVGICQELLPAQLIFENNIDSLTNKLNEVYEHYQDFVELFEPVKARKQDFSIEKMTERYLQAYQNLIQT